MTVKKKPRRGRPRKVREGASSNVSACVTLKQRIKVESYRDPGESLGDALRKIIDAAPER